MAQESEKAAAQAYAAATLAFKNFFETAPSYSEQKLEHLVTNITPLNYPGVTGIYVPRLQLHCEIDDGVRWFQTSYPTRTLENLGSVFIEYTCRDCGRWKKLYALLLEADKNTKSLTAMKLGEFPPFGSHVARRLQNLLSKEDLELYRKGLRSEREGNGIGAAAYFRRVVENHWKALIAKLRDAAERLGTAKERLEIFDEAAAQPQFSAAVDMLKDSIPPKLLILDGRNPLTLLYKPLSLQLHNLTDQECLQQAADIRTVLNELFDNIHQALKDDDALKGAVARLGG